MSEETFVFLNKERESGNNCNVIFICADDTIVYAHKLILECQCEYMVIQDHFNNISGKENNINKINLNFDSDVVNTFITYLYLDDIKIMRNYNLYKNILQLAMFLIYKESLIELMNKKYIKKFGLGKYAFDFCMMVSLSTPIRTIIIEDILYYKHVAGISIEKIISDRYKRSSYVNVMLALSDIIDRTLITSTTSEIIDKDRIQHMKDDCYDTIAWFSIDEDGIILKEKLFYVSKRKCEYNILKKEGLPIGVHLCKRHASEITMSNNQANLSNKSDKSYIPINTRPIILPSNNISNNSQHIIIPRLLPPNN